MLRGHPVGPEKEVIFGMIQAFQFIFEYFLLHSHRINGPQVEEDAYFLVAQGGQD